MSKTVVSIAVLYSLFAALSTAINIGMQMVSIWAYTGPYAVEVSILVGTIAGLPLRYVLEKRYIFSFTSQSIAHDGRLFVLYSFMGVLTTAIFWGAEYALHLIFDTDLMRYVGGVIGLAIGFYVKYQLDKKYVFVSSRSRVVV
ncbi:MAG: GtrA family protein [Alphaproteobacteria bacterium]|nr:GtrA family protein [Alphaproteobacteria bacterium]